MNSNRSSRAVATTSVMADGGVARGDRQSLQQWTSVQWMTLIVVLSAHVVLIQAMIMQPIFLVPTKNMPAMLSVPISQVALVTFWAMSGGKTYFRILPALLVVTVCWFTTMRFLGAVNPEGAASWLAGFSVESATIAIGVFLFRRRGRTKSIRRFGQFGLFALMAWTTIIAIALVLLKLGFQYFGWASGLALSVYFASWLIFSVGFGVVALVVAATVVSPAVALTAVDLTAVDLPPHQLLRRILYGIVCVVAFGLGMPILVRVITSQGVITVAEYCGIVIGEVLLIGASLCLLPFFNPQRSLS